MRRNFTFILAAMFGLFAFSTFYFGLHHDFFRRAAASAAMADVERILSQKTYVASDQDPAFICFGDSLTAGTGATLGHDYPSLLRDLYHRPTRNLGVGGETSAQISARMLARTRTAGPEWVMIWAGRNNFLDRERVLHDVDAMVQSLNPGSKFLVLGIINADLDDERQGRKSLEAILSLNEALAERYGIRFVDIRRELMRRANPRYEADRRDATTGVIPSSLRSDTVHLNDRGYAAVANAIELALIANGW